jgi:hypothetical protein
VQIIDNIPVWGASIDEDALQQIKTCYYIFGHAALMADHHKGYGVPIGGVIAHETLVSPSGVGYDIGCGNKAVLTDAPAGLFSLSPRTKRSSSIVFKLLYRRPASGMSSPPTGFAWIAN